MRRILPAAALAWCLAASPASWAQPLGAPMLPGPGPAGVINLNLIEVLVAVEALEVAGVFAFVPEAQAPFAMADYLMRDHKRLKKFVKKQEKDLKEVEGINGWDKQVLLYLVGFNSQPRLPAGLKRVPKKLMKRVNELSLANAMPLQMMVQRRAAKKK